MNTVMLEQSVYTDVVELIPGFIVLLLSGESNIISDNKINKSRWSLIFITCTNLCFVYNLQYKFS